MAENLIVKIIGDASKLTSELEKAGGNVKSFSEKIGSIGKSMTIVGGAVTAALGVIIKKTVDAGDAFNDMSLRTGISVENLSALAYVAKQSGTDIESMETSLKFLTRAMDDTSKGTGTAKDTFTALGISVVDTEGKLKPITEVMMDIADKIAAIDDPAKQAAIAMELFGARSGTQLLPMLKMGGTAIEEIMKKAQELGIVMSTESAQAADEFKDRMYDLKESLGAVGRDIANVLIPPLLDFTNKAIEIVKRIREWADAHKPLIEAIILIGAKLAVFAAVGGPILMAVSALAKLKTAFTVLGTASAGPIGIFIAALAGIIVVLPTLIDKITGTSKELRDFREELENMSLVKVNLEIQNLIDEGDELQKQYYETAKVLGENSNECGALAYAIEQVNIKLKDAYERQEELNTAEKDGIETTNIIIPLTKEQSDAVDKLGDANKTLGDRIYQLTHTEMEYNIKKLYEQAQAYTDMGVPMKDVAKWVELEQEAMSKLDIVLNTGKTSWADYRKEFEDVAFKIPDFTDALKIMSDRVYELTHTTLENNIKKLEELKKKYIEMGGPSDKIIEWFKKENEELIRQNSLLTNTETSWADFRKKFEDVALGLGGTAKKLTSDISLLFGTLLTNFTNNFVKPFIGKIVDELTPAVENFFFGIEGYEANWGSFWSGLWDTLKTYISNMIVKLLIAIPLMLVWNFLTGGITSWASLLKIWNWLGFEKGGGVKKYDFGGGVDTIPAMLTPGEYVISKPMTDFIKKFKVIPQNLIGAISMGMPTPVPALAGGGIVGNPSISGIGFGETKIYVDIHDNKISDDVDIKKLASTVSDEILRKISLNRRH